MNVFVCRNGTLFFAYEWREKWNTKARRPGVTLPFYTKACVVANLDVIECLGTSKYLGYVRDCVWRKIHQWSGRHLSKARREVLVKFMAQSIPAYCMGTF